MPTLTFAHPNVLLFLLAIPVMVVVHLVTLRRARTKAIVFANFEAIKRVADAKQGHRSATGTSRRIVLLIYRVLTFTLLVLAVAGTTYWYHGLSTNQDFVLAIDSSSSMLAGDIQPSRFAAAKQSAIDFIDTLHGSSRVGVVGFSGSAFVALTPTNDYADAKRIVNGLQIRPEAGTDIASAIIESVDLLKTSNRSRTIVLITDGRQTQGASLSDALDFAKQSQVKIYPIGIGTRAGGTFLRTDLISTLDPQTLDQIASATGTKSYTVNSSSQIENAFTSIAGLTQSKVPVHVSGTLALVALSMLFLEWGLIATRFRELP